MRLALVLASIVLAAACDSPTGGDPSGPVGAGGPIGGNSAGPAEAVDPLDAGDLPRMTEALRFVGDWATEEGSCESAAWKFTETTLQTPAGSNCSFNRVTQVPGGYDIQATCTAEAPPTSDTLKLRFAERADAMTFQSETVSDAKLVFCGREV